MKIKMSRLVIVALVALFSAYRTHAQAVASMAANLRASDAAPPAKSSAAPPAPKKIGALTFTGSWRVRAEAWDFFQPTTGQNTYGFEHSLLRLALSQKRENFDWLLEGAADAIVGLP